MPDIRADEIVLQTQHKRTFIQFGGPRVGNAPKFYGVDAQYLVVQGVKNSELGGIDPVWVPDPQDSRKFRLVGRMISPQDLPDATLVMREKHGSIPRQLMRIDCVLNLYEPTGPCSLLSDFVGGWKDYVQIYSKGMVTDKDEGDRTTFDGDDAQEDSLTVVFSDIYPIGPLSFGETANTQIDREVIDLHYAPSQPCVGCSYNDQRLYAVTKSSGAGSPGLGAEIIYSVDGGITWNQANIDNIGATEDPLGLEIVGNYIVILGANAYYYASVEPETGLLNSTFVKVTAGFVGGFTPSDIYVLSPREIFFSASGGYIYKSTDITVGVSVVSAASATSSNLLRIASRGDTIVIVGASGIVLKSLNRGVTWISTDTTPTANGLQAVSILDERRYWVGSNSGRVFYTDNGGITWVTIALPGLGTGGITDILFVTDEVGYIAHATNTPTARLFTTWDGGQDWTQGKYRIINWPVFSKAGRLAAPATSEPSWVSNTLAIGGLSGGGTDGIILVGNAARV
jgi:hypothetical protein